MKTNITFFISNINKALAFEWLADYLNKEKFNLRFILLNPGDTVLENYLKNNNIPVDRITYQGKKDVPSAILKCVRILLKQKPDIIHAHLFDACIVGLIASKIACVQKRIFTRHHSTSQHEYHPNSVKYDRLCNYLSSDIVATSENVKNILIEKEKVNPSKIHLIHHGFDLNSFENVSSDDVKNLEEKFHLQKRPYPIVGTISRYLELKGVQYIIPAFKKLLENYPDALLLLANGEGNYKNEIQILLQSLPKKNYLEIPFEQNLFALYKLFDVFVHVPINKQCEAFGQTYVEALASGVPSVFTLSGIANEFIVGRENALVVDFKNSGEIYEAICELLNKPSLCENLIVAGKQSVQSNFSLSKMINALESLYLSEL